MFLNRAILLIALTTTAAQAAIITVGPGEAISHIAEAARIAKDGDIILIKPGIYRADVTLWKQRKLEIRGIGQRPIIIADGQSSEGKAIWVFRQGEFKVENIEFRGTRVRDGNGAGIRLERAKLEITNCVFEDNQNGILTANFDDAELHIRDSVFRNAPRDGNDLHHLLYVGRIKHFTVEGSRFHNGFRGHLIKSRARISEIRYNLIVDGPDGGASYEIDLPNGGDALLVGNVIGQSASSQNPVVVAFGAEGPNWPDSRLQMAHNTLLNEGWRPAWFVRIWQDKLPHDTGIITRNNLTVGLGSFTTTLSGDHSGNYPLLPGALDPSNLNLALTASSLLRGLVEPPSTNVLNPTSEFIFPVGTQPLRAPTKWVPGAFQSPEVPVKSK
tara:strand:- start:22840 stop:23997 length:1158 start_codon:yes stop_codon:yes gene_type:complete